MSSIKSVDISKKTNDKVNAISFANFDLYLLGPIIAKLIAYNENENYEFYVAKYKLNMYLSEEEKTHGLISNVYSAFLINRSTNIFNSYEETYLKDDKIKVLSEDPNMVILKLEPISKFKDKDESEKKSFSIKDVITNLSKYHYVYDFINYITEYKSMNDIDELNKEELYELLKTYIDKDKTLQKTKKN